MKKIFSFSVLGWDISIVNRKEGVRLLEKYLKEQQEYDDYLRDIYEANMNEEKQT